MYRNQDLGARLERCDGTVEKWPSQCLAWLGQMHASVAVWTRVSPSAGAVIEEQERG